jgi:hypothetical protein
MDNGYNIMMKELNNLTLKIYKMKHLEAEVVGDEIIKVHIYYCMRR